MYAPQWSPPRDFSKLGLFNQDHRHNTRVDVRRLSTPAVHFFLYYPIRACRWHHVTNMQIRQ